MADIQNPSALRFLINDRHAQHYGRHMTDYLQAFLFKRSRAFRRFLFQRMEVSVMPVFYDEF